MNFWKQEIKWPIGLYNKRLMKSASLQLRFILPLLAILVLTTFGNAQHCKVAIQALPNFCDPNSDVITLTVIPTTDPDPPYTYIWSTGATTQTITVPNVVGLITVTVINASGCPASAFYFIPGPQEPFAYFGHCFTCCPGDIQILEAWWTNYLAPPNITYVWSTGETTSTIETNIPGYYSVTITDPANGCTTVVGGDVFYLEATEVEIDGPSSLCSGQTATLTTVGGPFSFYEWFPNGETTSTIEVSQPGTYIVVVTEDGVYCPDSDTIVIEPGSGSIPPPQLSGPAELCPDQIGTIVVVNENDYSGFIWNTGETTFDIEITDPGTYTVTVSDGGGCTNSASIIVDPGNPNFAITGATTPVTSCTSPNGSIDISINPAGSYTFDWSNGAITQDINNLDPDTYTVTVTDAGGCTASASFTVTSNVVLPGITSSITSTSCDLSNGAVDLSVTPPGTYTFLWSNGITAEDLSNIPAGTYAVTVTSTSNGCTANASVTVPNINPLITITGSTIPLTSCTTPNGAIDISLSPTGSYTYAWSNGASTEDISNLTSGSYTVTVSAGGSCTATSSFSVANNTITPMPVATSTDATCGQNNGGVDLNVIPTGTYTYLWSNGSISEDLITVPGGTYSVTVTSVDGCTNTTSVLVPDISIPLLITGTTSPNTSCSQPNGAIDITVSTPGVFTFIWSNGDTSEDLQQQTGGTYSVTVTSTDGCTGSVSFDITNSNSTFTFNGSVLPNTSCLSPNGSIDVSVIPAGTYTFIWTSGASTEDLLNLSAGNFGLTVTDVNNCSSIASFTIEDLLSTPEVSSQVTPSSCGIPNGAIDLSIIPVTGNTFSWSNGSVTEDQMNLAAGIYTVTVTGANGCIKTDTITVANLNSNFTLSATTMPNQSCLSPNGSVDLTVSPTGTYTFAWNNGTITQDLLNIQGGTYSVIVTDSLNCSASDTFLVANNTAVPVLSATITGATCGTANGAIDLTIFPTLNNTFLWSNDSITEDLANLTPGTYSVMVSDSNGCNALDTFAVQNINNNFSLSASTAPNTSCTNPNGTIDLTITPSGVYTISWSNGSITEDLANLTTGSYIVTVTDMLSCASTDTFVVITSAVAVSISSIITPSSCGMNNGAIDLTLIPSNGNTMVWSNGAITEDIQNLPTGDYNVTVTGSNGCTSIDSFTVPALGSIITLSASLMPNTNCVMSNGAINLTVIPTGTYTFNWSNAMATEDLANLLPGNYTVTVSDLNGCSSSDIFTIDNQVLLPSIAQSIIPSTCGNTNGQIDITVSPSGTYTFIWSNGSTNEDLQNITSGTYSLTVTGANGCDTSATLIVPNNTNSFSMSAISSDNTSCTSANGSINLTITPQGVYTVLWSNGATTEDIQNLQPGTYSVTVTDPSNCSNMSSVTIDNNVTTLLVEETITPALCGELNGSIDLNVNPSTGNTFIWSNGSVTEDLNNIQSGLYDVTITGKNGCTWNSEFNVPGTEPISIQLEADAINSGDDSITIHTLVNVPLSTIDIINWFPEPLFQCNQNLCLEQTIVRPLQQTEIMVMVIDTNGCMAEARLTLRVDISPEVYIPNVFSPNNDGINDFFTIYGNKDVEQIVELRIYDRWGNFVFTKNEFPPNIENYGWDGSFRDKEMNPAVFVYGARVLMKDGSQRFYKGDVTLVR